MKSINYLVSTAICLMSLHAQAKTELYVSPSGSDSNPGTEAKPFQSIVKARDAVRELKTTAAGDITVYLRGGTHQLSETLEFTAADSAAKDSKIIYQAYKEEKPVISGGQVITGWQQHKGDIYKAKLDYDLKLRALYVNGVPANMARSKEFIRGLDGWGAFKITGDEPWADTPGTEAAGIKFPKDRVGLFRNPEDIELIASPSTWCRQRLAVEDMFKEGDTVVVKMQQPGFSFALSHKWAKCSPNSRWQFVNVFELLDEPGEFYFDRKTKELYYFKRAGEDMSSAEVVAPVLEKLITLQGNSSSDRVSGISFSGIAFKHNNFLLMDRGKLGCTTIQSIGMTVRYREDGNWHMSEYNMIRPMDAAIEVASAKDISFSKCRLENLTGVGLSFLNDTVDCRVEENIFKHIEASAINIGHPQHYKIGDGRIFTGNIEGPCVGTVVRNNVLRHISYEHIQAPGIVAFFVAGTDISHNDLKDLPYSGISFGWWWGNSRIPPSTTMKDNKIQNNRIFDVIRELDDGGGVYLLGFSPNSILSGNYINGSHGGKKKRANGIHPDDRTSYWTLKDNVMENINGDAMHLWRNTSEHNTVTGNFSNGAKFYLHGVESVFENNQVIETAPPWKDPRALEIIRNAGLEPRCKYLLEER
jgi:hypothetical protein